MRFILLILLSLFLTIVNCWDLSSWGFKNNNYYVSSVAVYGTRVFISLPRSVCHNENKDNPTVIELSKTGDHFFITLNARHKILDHQKWNDCADIQDAISLTIDPRKYKLWILDKGNDICQPKVMSYNLFYNSLSESVELVDVPRRELNMLVIDRQDAVAGLGGHRAYIGNAGENILLVLSMDKLKWWKVNLESPAYPTPNIHPDFIAVSKTTSELFLTGKTGTEIYSLDLTNIRVMEEPVEIEEENLYENVTFRGHKLGKSSCLETDYKSGVNYYMVRDFAILRWITEFPIQAEYHNVLAQSYEMLPYVSQLFTGPQFGLWALVNPLGPEECSMATKNATDIPNVEIRMVKILRYNRFLDEITVEERIK